MTSYRAKPPKRNPISRSGLVVTYPLTEGSGLTVQDPVGGTANAGTLANGPVWGACEYGTRLSFASASLQAVGVGRSLRQGGPHSLFALFRWSGSAGINRFVAGNNNSGGDAAIFVSRLASTGFLRGGFRGSDGNYYEASGATTIASGVWYVGGYVFDGTAVQVYLNGKPDGSALSCPTPPMTTPGNFALGRPGDFVNSAYFWDGDIAGAWLYKTAVKTSTIRAIAADPFYMFRRRPRLKSSATITAPGLFVPAFSGPGFGW